LTFDSGQTVRGAFLDQPSDQTRIFDASHPVVDPLGVQEIERLPDVVGRTLFTGVGDGAQARLPRSVINRPELRRGMADFRGIEPDAQDPIPIRQGPAKRLHRGVLAQVAQKTQDEPAGDLEPVAGVLEGAMDPGDHHFEGHAPIGVRLWVEEDLGMANSLPGRPIQVRPGQLVEVLLL
jgi:hypothetical protein